MSLTGRRAASDSRLRKRLVLDCASQAEGHWWTGNNGTRARLCARGVGGVDTNCSKLVSPVMRSAAIVSLLTNNLDGADGYYIEYGAAQHGLAQTLTRTVPVYVEQT
jgi:hypothetical protein